MTDIVQGENNNSAQAECMEGTEGIQADNKNAQYLLVDYGEKLVTEMDFTRSELHRQAVSLLEKIELLWEVVRAFIILIIPVITGLGVAIFSRMYLPHSIAPWVFTIFFGITVGFIFLNLTPLTEAVSNYLDFKVYKPQFGINCKCDNCQSRRKLDLATQTSENDIDNAENVGKSTADETDSPPDMPNLNEMD